MRRNRRPGRLDHAPAGSARSTSSPTEPYRGNPVAVVHDADGLDDERDAALRAVDQPVRDDVPAAAHRRRAPTTGCASSRRARSCRSPATRRSARATPGSRPAASARDPAQIVQECAAGLIRIGAAGTGSPSPRPRSSAMGRSTRRTSPTSPTRSASRARRSSMPSGPTTARAGSRVLLTSRRRGPRARSPASVDLRSRRRRPASGRAPRRAFEVRASSRVTGRPSRTRSPAASTRRSPAGCSGPAGPRRRTSPAREPRSAGPAASTSARTTDGTIWVGGGTITCIRGEVEI